jgi:hypothetical protein
MDGYLTNREFRAFMDAMADRLADRLDALEAKIDNVTKRQNRLNGAELLDTQDLCLLLKASKRTIQRHRKNGVLPYYMIEGKVYYKSTDIHEFIRKSFNPAKPADKFNSNSNPQNSKP